jgi:uncharacterized alpha-E superfamily protein
MLSRIAANCLWLARYLERAENTARLIGVAQWRSLLPEYHGGDPAPWRWLMQAAADPFTWPQVPERDPGAAVIALLIHDHDHASSLWSCLRAVRENARTARFALTTATWEAANTTWIEARALDPEMVAARGVEDVLAWTTGRCQWIRGAIEDLLDGDTARILAVGRALERFDSTARTLGLLLPEAIADGAAARALGSPAHRRWEALIGAGGVQDWFRHLGGEVGDLEATVRMIALDPRQQRSLASCARRLDGCLGELAAGRPTDASRQAAALSREVGALDAATLIARPERLTALVAAGNRLAQAVAIDHCGQQAVSAPAPAAAEGQGQTQSQTQTQGPEP